MGSLNKSGALRRKEFVYRLAEINCRKCVGSSIMLLILVPVAYALLRLTGFGMDGRIVGIIMVVIELFQLLSLLVMGRIVKQDEKDTMTYAYHIYYALTILGFVILASFEYKNTGSLLIFAGALVYYIFIPIIPKSEQGYCDAIVASYVVCFCVSIYGHSVRDIADAALIGIFGIIIARRSQGDMRQLEWVNAELKEKTAFSENDPLTGLINRRGLTNKANVLWPYCARGKNSVGVIVIDIDYFKKYNDRFGHPEGDRCLKKIAGTINSCIINGTDFASRIGGEVFLVFLQDATTDDAVKMALRIRQSIASLKIDQGYVGSSNYLTVSMGVAVVVPDETNSFNKLYEMADQSLYQAKESGRNCVVCDNRIYGRMKNGMGTSVNV